MKKFLFVLVFLSTTARADMYDAFVRSAGYQDVLGVVSSNDSLTVLQDKSGATIDVSRNNVNETYAKMRAEYPSDDWMEALIESRPLSTLGTLKAQRTVTRTLIAGCYFAGGGCVFLASTAVVFWPNAVIAGACGAAVYLCQAKGDEIIQTIDAQIKAEQSAAGVSGGSSGSDPQSVPDSSGSGPETPMVIPMRPSVGGGHVVGTDTTGGGSHPIEWTPPSGGGGREPDKIEQPE